MAPDPLTPYGNRPMVTPIVNAVNYEYSSFEVLRQITDGAFSTRWTRTFRNSVTRFTPSIRSSPR